MIKRAAVILACALAIPAQAQASTAAIAGAAASTAAMASASSSKQQQMPQGISGAPIEWAEVGWLMCSVRYSAPAGCRKTVERDWRPDTVGEVGPWIEWMKRHKGPDARFMGMTVVKGDVRLFYGVPAGGES